MIRLALLLFFSLNAQAEMIFLDLNDAPKERAACEEGIQSKGIAGERKETLHVVDPSKHKKENGENYQRSPAYHALRKKIKSMISAGTPIDSIVISGEDGSGDFFGSNGKFQYYEFQEIVEEFPSVAKTLKSAALWGCYPSTVVGSEQYWLNKLPNMQFTMGFVTQGPNKDRKAGHDLLRQFCERRQEAAQATTMEALCRFYDSLQQLTPTSVGVCNRLGVASKEYAVGGKGEKCFTYKQLHDRCPSFIKNKELQAVYDRYMSGDSEPPSESETKMSDLRYYYNEVNKWRHCAAKFREDRRAENKRLGVSETERPTGMPVPQNLIRLIKYKKVKENIMKVNSSQLAEYDENLERVGLGRLKVGDITQLSRKSLNEKIQNAVLALQGQTVEIPATSAPPVETAPVSTKECVGGTGFLFGGCAESAKPAPRAAPMSSKKTVVRGVSDPTLLRMAQCMRQTFVNINHECIPFDLVGDHPKKRSPCLMNYEEAKEVSPDDICK